MPEKGRALILTSPSRMLLTGSAHRGKRSDTNPYDNQAVEDCSVFEGHYATACEYDYLRVGKEVRLTGCLSSAEEHRN